MSKSHAKRDRGPQNLGPSGDLFEVPKLSLHGIYIPNGCKHLFLQSFYWSEANSHKPLKKEKKISGIERLVLPFPDT